MSRSPETGSDVDAVAEVSSPSTTISPRLMPMRRAMRRLGFRLRIALALHLDRQHGVDELEQQAITGWSLRAAHHAW